MSANAAPLSSGTPTSSGCSIWLSRKTRLRGRRWPIVIAAVVLPEPGRPSMKTMCGRAIGGIYEMWIQAMKGCFKFWVFTLKRSVTSPLLGAFALAVPPLPRSHSNLAAAPRLVTVKLAWRCHAVGRLDGRCVSCHGSRSLSGCGHRANRDRRRETVTDRPLTSLLRWGSDFEPLRDLNRTDRDAGRSVSQTQSPMLRLTQRAG